MKKKNENVAKSFNDAMKKILSISENKNLSDDEKVELMKEPIKKAKEAEKIMSKMVQKEARKYKERIRTKKEVKK